MAFAAWLQWNVSLSLISIQRILMRNYYNSIKRLIIKNGALVRRTLIPSLVEKTCFCFDVLKRIDGHDSLFLGAYLAQ